MEVNLLVAWDSFTREGLERKCLGQGSCDGCGNHRKRMFTYAPRNSRLPVKNPKKFCNLECYRTYNI